MEKNGTIPRKDNWNPDWEKMSRRRGDGTSPLARTSSEAMAQSILSDVDPWTAWLYKPHTAIVTVAGAGLLVYVVLRRFPVQ